MRIFILIILALSIVSCCRQATYQSFTRTEYEILAKNCEYIESVFKRSLELDSNGAYKYDEKKVTLLGLTKCFKNIKPDELIEKLGIPSRTTDLFLSYDFKIGNKDNYYRVNFRITDGIVTENGLLFFTGE